MSRTNITEPAVTDIHTTATETGHIARRAPRGRYLFVLSLAALGVVYGDIGTSPLYAMREWFMEDPDIPKVLENLSMPGFAYVPQDTTYFPGREIIIASKRPGMALWREKIFSIISPNATSATAYFCIPPDRVVEMGEQIEI